MAALSDRIVRSILGSSRDRDRHQHIIAHCREGTEDLDRWMVAAGWAVAYHKLSFDHADGDKGPCCRDRHMVGAFSDAVGRALKGDETLNTLLKQPLLFLLLSAFVSGCTGIPESVEPVRPFDLQRYKGEWFEIMRLDHSFERGMTNVTATYTLRDDGSVSVLNRGFDRKNCRWKEAAGRAVFQGDQDTASLSVTFFWPFAGGYHVIALDQQDYGWALISGPSRNYLWILARRPDLSPDIRNRLVDQARRAGFPVDDLILVDHDKPDCAPGQPSAGGKPPP